MKLKNMIRAILITGVVSSYAGLGIGDLMVDTDVKMQVADGTFLTLSDVRGRKGTLVIFTCNKCPFVEAWQDVMVELGNTYKKKGIGVVFVNSNDPSVKGDTLENMKKKAEKEGYKFPYVADATSDVARHFGAKKTPDVFLFDNEEKLVYQGAVGEGGRRPSGEVWLKEALEALVTGKKIEKSKTKAIGCTIKFR